MRLSTLLSACLAMLLITEPAAAFTSRNNMRVNQVSAAVFEAIPHGPSTASDYWCAASDYARLALGAPWSAELYIVRGLGPSATTNRRTAVQFTLDPAAAGVTPKSGRLSLNLLAVGTHMSIQLAETHCDVPFARF